MLHQRQQRSRHDPGWHQEDGKLSARLYQNNVHNSSKMPKAPNNRVYTAKQDLHKEVSSHGNGIMCVSDSIIHL